VLDPDEVRKAALARLRDLTNALASAGGPAEAIDPAAAVDSPAEVGGPAEARAAGAVGEADPATPLGAGTGT
jgi:hypothetical protein